MTDDDVLTLFLLGYSSSLYSPFGECQRESDVLPFLLIVSPFLPLDGRVSHSTTGIFYFSLISRLLLLFTGVISHSFHWLYPLG
ncbi:hypothetical protein BDV30DRAFT_139256 [Aspergillus minisclerotigenes]|uniref:Uncharacterized protein n=1 Tax=Aspergillus minisclerotigenes TaxID=656917 RepID=A0A5N6J0X3_9EURO|nr:hypothetical protein BDV30DRAFT_139256 [Aspergillus minisclerotigenes]